MWHIKPIVGNGPIRVKVNVLRLLGALLSLVLRLAVAVGLVEIIDTSGDEDESEDN